MAIIVTPEAPVKAVKMAQDTSATTDSPPGKKARDTPTRRPGAPLSDSR